MPEEVKEVATCTMHLHMNLTNVMYGEQYAAVVRRTPFPDGNEKCLCGHGARYIVTTLMRKP
jgi:hypothetical protein